MSYKKFKIVEDIIDKKRRSAESLEIKVSGNFADKEFSSGLSLINNTYLIGDNKWVIYKDGWVVIEYLNNDSNKNESIFINISNIVSISGGFEITWF